MAAACDHCAAAGAPYTCPRCNRRLCSLGCYRGHGACAEAFYREQVLRELRSQPPPAPSERARLGDALGRLREAGEDGAGRGGEGRGGEQRGLWGRLSEEQKAEFRRMLRSGEAVRLLPPWRPWWWGRRRLVEEIGGGGAASKGRAAKKGTAGRSAAGEAGGGSASLDKEAENDVAKKRAAKKGTGGVGYGGEAVLANKKEEAIRKDEDNEEPERRGAGGNGVPSDGSGGVGGDESAGDGGGRGVTGDDEDSDGGGDASADEHSDGGGATSDNGDSADDEAAHDGVPGPAPPTPTSVPPLSSFRAPPPSPLLRFQLPNVLYGYAFALSLHNGDDSLLPDVPDAAVAASAALRCRRPFSSTAEALLDARRSAEAAGYPRCPLGDAGTVLAVAELMRGRSRHRPTEDAETALRHMETMLEAARRAGSGEERERLGRARRKCGFLLAWSRERGAAALREMAAEAEELGAKMAGGAGRAEGNQGGGNPWRWEP